MASLVSSPTIESLAKKLHELSVKQSTTEVVKAATPSPQNSTIFAQSSQKGNHKPIGKNKKGKKGEGNQNKKKPTNNPDGGQKYKKKVKFPCKLC